MRHFEFLPLYKSTRGPLSSNHARLFPDLCATGAGAGGIIYQNNSYRRVFRFPGTFGTPGVDETCLLTPGIDGLDPVSLQNGPNVAGAHRAVGTSAAAAQVSGAAALYRGRRSAAPNYATAEETRAALLLNVLGTFTSADGQAADSGLQHAYRNRNTFGVGYLRDDLLAEFAMRQPSCRALVEQINLNATGPSASLAYPAGGLVSGQRYGVVACWRRYLDLDTGDFPPPETDLADVDLEVSYSGVVLARSQSRGNSYERLVFVAPPGSTGNQVTLRVFIHGSARGDQDVGVHLAAREFPVDADQETTVADPVLAGTGATETRDPGSTCTVNRPNWTVARIVPAPYQNAHGSAAFQEVWGPGPWTFSYYEHAGYRGFNLSYYSNLGVGSNYANWQQLALSPSVVGGPITIDGIAFRCSSPLVFQEHTMSVTIVESTSPLPFQSPPTTQFHATALLDGVPSGAGTLEMNTWPVRLHFSQPFSYSGGYLTLWFAGPTQAVDMIVDGTDDAPDPQYVTSYRSPSGLNSWTVTSKPGKAPIMAFLQRGTLAARPAEILVYGEPWSSNGSSNNNLLLRLAAAPGQVFSIAYGFPATTPQIAPPCQFWLQSGYGALPLGVTDAAGFGTGILPIVPGLVHAQIGVQAILAPNLFSTPVILTIGGVL